MSPQHKLMPTEEMIEAGEMEMLDAFYEAEQYGGYRKPRATPPDAFDLRILKGLRAVLAMSAARPTTDVSTDGLVGLLSALAGDCDNTDGWEDAAPTVREAASRIEALQRSNAEKDEALLDIRNRILCPVGPSPTLDEIAQIARKALEDKTLSNGGGE
jgi:hypothetical protein